MVLIGAQAYADVVKQVARPNNFVFHGAGLSTVPLDSVGKQFITFSGSGRFTIIYSAECAAGGTGGNWVNINIRVDGVELAPTGNNTEDAFCSANHTETVDDGWVTATTSGRTVSLPAGTHAVRLTISTSLGKQGWLGDRSLLIIK